MRTPIRNNLVSIVSAIVAAGVALIPENGEGAGVRFRKVELEYSRNLKVRGGDIVIQLRYRGKNFIAVAPSDIIHDLDHATSLTTEQKVKAVQNHLPKYLVAAENIVSSAGLPVDDIIVFKDSHFPNGTFQ